MPRTEVLYRFYVTAILALFAFYLALGIVDDAPIDDGVTDWIRADSGSWVGLVGALAIAAGLRSGATGGPLAIDERELHHVFLSPIARGVVLRGPVSRLIGAALGVAAVVGLAIGILASRRLPGDDLEWLASGLVATTCIVGAGIAAALIASGHQLRQWLATALGGILVAWALVDIRIGRSTSPTSLIGDVAIWPMDFLPISILAPCLVLAGLVVGYLGRSGLSADLAHRRSRLVRSVRFALAQQDIRALILLRRQLGFERPRVRPLVRIGPGRLADRFPVIWRDACSYTRWPWARIVRVVSLAVVAGIALAGAWRGTTALFVGAALLLYLAAIEVVEPLAQELDHPSIAASTPIPAGEIAAQHLLASLMMMLPVWAIAGLTGAAVATSSGLLVAVLFGLVPGAMTAVGGAALSIRRVGSDNQGVSFQQAELAGPRAVIRLVWPPALVGAGLLSMILGSRAMINDQPMLPPMATGALVAAVLGVGCGFWVRVRDQMPSLTPETSSN